MLFSGVFHHASGNLPKNGYSYGTHERIGGMSGVGWDGVGGCTVYRLLRCKPADG